MNIKTYTLIISDDPLFSGRIRRVLSKNEISIEWRTLVFSNSESNEEKDFKLDKLFELILKIKKVNIVVFFDFEKKEEFCLDLIKIFNKYQGAQYILQICFFGEENPKTDLEAALAAGAHMVEYKRPDLDDIVTNIQYLKNSEFNFLPEYATSRGYDTVLWPRFFCKIKHIDPQNILATTTFDKLNPSDEWIKRFIPQIGDGKAMVSNSESLEKKCRWIEDINTLKFEYSENELLTGDFLNISSVEKDAVDTFTYKLAKRVSPSEFEEVQKKTKKIFSKMVDTRVRVMVIDKRVKLLQKNHETEKQKANLFSYPFLSMKHEDQISCRPHIIALQWDQLTILDENSNELSLNDDQKIHSIESYIKKLLNEDTVLIIFGLHDIDIKKISKTQLNVPFDITSDFLNKIISVYEKKIEHNPLRVEEVLGIEEIKNFEVDPLLKLEFPIIIEKLNEHRLTFSSPMKISDKTVIKFSTPCVFYLLVLDKLADKDFYGGLIMGVDELEKSLLRREVNRLLRIPIEAENEQDKLKFVNLNSAELIKRQKETLKKNKKDVVDKLKDEQ
ncbi:hypothetical protein [Bacteriovorax sp. Seq25_V]|uniref:hypothetical protein n=1 Tax=Bacteriovorax sp. Seq25_V TaxID=1201288 RepID=UPI00038A14C2|nr:hypothetical protein [Bacteriovorax sp. Seq25_V]EQC45430.1 hypothetical protein M900_2049 [Bacteriovorax sp. Seq25_V]